MWCILSSWIIGCDGLDGRKGAFCTQTCDCKPVNTFTSPLGCHTQREDKPATKLWKTTVCPSVSLGYAGPLHGCHMVPRRPSLLRRKSEHPWAKVCFDATVGSKQGLQAKKDWHSPGLLLALIAAEQISFWLFINLLKENKCVYGKQQVACSFFNCLFR